MQIIIPSLLRIKPNASHRLGKYLRNASLQRVAVFLPESLNDWYHQIVKISLASSDIEVVHCVDVVTSTIESLTTLLGDIPSSAEALLAIGGGRIIDAAKYVGNILNLPVLSVPTAISNDGFASPFSSVEIAGKRRTLQTIMPYGVVIDTDLIQKAPIALYYSGIGDLISKATALPDWKLAYHQKGTPVNDFSWSLAKMTFDRWLAYTDKQPDNPEHITILANALLFSGLSMAIAGNSRPASGAEHLISHAYDHIAPSPTFHGIQVGMATYAISPLYGVEVQRLVSRQLDDTGFFDFVAKHPLNREAFYRSIEMAPTMKAGFYSALSLPEAREQTLQFVGTDARCRELLQ
jgi:glycerol-1-phosphate dehydrogenase [NAD(P)+]